MSILFINLHYEPFNPLSKDAEENPVGCTLDTIPLPPLTVMDLAALTPNDYDLRYSDSPEDIDFEMNYDMVCISTVTPSVVDAYKIADRFREKGIKVVLGGYHASALPEEAKQHADSVVIGEAEETWPQLLKDFEKGKLKPFYRQTRPVDLSTIPSPRRDIFDNEILPVAPIQATRGCPVGCSFCAITNTSFGRTYRERPIEHVINEVETIPQKFLFFCDASLTADPEYTKQLFKEMKDLEKRLLMCNGNVNVLKKDEELLKLASEAGCLQWHIGFESVSQKNIDGVGKNTNKVEDYFSTVQKIHDHGIDVIGEFILGFDNDTVDTFSLTRDFVEHLEVDAAGFNILVPYPGTPLFERLEREGRILTKDWSQYTCTNVVFKPKHISQEMLIEETWKLNKKFFLDRINNVAAKWIHTNKK